jgi:hypothetical protein
MGPSMIGDRAGEVVLSEVENRQVNTSSSTPYGLIYGNNFISTFVSSSPASLYVSYDLAWRSAPTGR